jgi:phosphatidylserine decarboxylase
VTERPPESPVFEERLTGLFAPDVYRFALPLLLLGGIALGLSWTIAGVVFTGLGLFCVAFFRNPNRTLPPGEGLVVAPADGRVLCVDEIEGQNGEKALRIGIFLSVFNVHVNRAPVAGRILEIERSGTEFLAAFNRDAETRNVQLRMALDTPAGRVDVVQITGLIARRIVCHAEVGDWLTHGVRYGLIRFGSRTDVVLPIGASARVAKGDTVRGGKTVIAELGAIAS